MKIQVLLIVLLAVGLAFVSWKWASASSSTQETGDTGSALENIMTRTSIRSYTADTVSNDNVETLLRAAMAAPSAGNKQPWRFIVIEKRATLDTIASRFGSMKMAAQAPLAILVCGDTDATFPEDGRDYWIEDTSAAMENLLLAAHASGLGAVWCGVYPKQDRVADFSEMFSLPDNIIPMGLAVIGHPADSPAPKDKWTPDNIHYETWNDR